MRASRAGLVFTLVASTSLVGCLPKDMFGDDNSSSGPNVSFPDAGPGDGDGDTFDGFDGFSDGGEVVAPPAPERLSPTRHTKRMPPPISGGTLAVSSDDAFAIAADSDRDRVHIINLKSGQVRSIQLQDGAEPGRVTLGAEGRAHVIERSKEAIATIDVTGAKLLQETHVGSFPRGIAYRAGSGELFVALASGDLVTLNEADQTEKARTALDYDLRDVVIDGFGQLWVSRYRSAELLLVDGGEIKQRIAANVTQDLGFPPPMRATQLSRMLLNQRGELSLLHQRSQDSTIVPDVGGYSGGGDPCGAIVKTYVSAVDSDGNVDGPALSGSTVAVDAAYSPDGNTLAVATPSGYIGSHGTIHLYSMVTIGGTTSDDQCGAFPGQDAVLDAQATAVAFTAAGNLLVQSRDPASLLVFNLDPGGNTNFDPTVSSANLVQAYPLASDSVRDTGHDLFYADVGSGLACASCHPEGREDGHTWDFSTIGRRRTQNLGGGLRGTEPFHWQGDMANFPTLIVDVMQQRMSGFATSDEQQEALLDWLDAQPALSLGGESDAITRGKTLFTSSACASCHSGARFSNGQSFDIGKGERLQVPSLLGLALRAPYMHDGCAATLKDRFDPACGGTAHGDTSKLTQAQIDDLISYLKTL